MALASSINTLIRITMRAKSGSWFETKIKYQKTQEDGSEKVVSECYIVEALSCTGAEASIIEEMAVCSSGDMNVLAQRRRISKRFSSLTIVKMTNGTQQSSNSSRLMKRVRRRSVLTWFIWFSLSRWLVPCVISTR